MSSIKIKWLLTGLLSFSAYAWSQDSRHLRIDASAGSSDWAETTILVPQIPSNAFWHENRLDATGFCSTSIINSLLESGQFTREGLRHPSDLLQPLILGQDALRLTKYASIPGDFIAYDPSINCRNIDGKTKGSLSFGVHPIEDEIVVGQLIFNGIENRSILSTSYFALSSDVSRGPWVIARMKYSFNNDVPRGMTSPVLPTYRLSLKYLTENGEWKTTRGYKYDKTYGWTRTSVLPIRDRTPNEELLFAVNLPYDTLVQLNVEPAFDLLTVKSDHVLAPIYGDHLFPTIHEFSLLTETCVPDLVAGECLQ